MRDSDEQFLERLRHDAVGLLGPGVDLRALRSEDSGSVVRITAECHTPDGPRTIEALGTSLIDAAGSFLARLPVERLAFTFRRLIADGHPTARR